MNNTQNQVLLIAIMLLLLAVIILLFYKLPRPSSTAGPEATAETGEPPAEAGSEDKLGVALRLLDENERMVVEALAAEGGTMLQKDISYSLGFSRVKTHRVVQGLVKRGLVTVEEHYNTKKVTLVDWLRE